MGMDRLACRIRPNHFVAPANYCVKLSAGRLPRPGLKPLGRPETRGVTPLADLILSLIAASGVPLSPQARGGSPQVRRLTLGGPAKQRRFNIYLREMRRPKRRSRSLKRPPQLSSYAHRPPRASSHRAARARTISVGLVTKNSRRTDVAGRWPRALRVGHQSARALLPSAESYACGRPTAASTCQRPVCRSRG